MYPDWSAAGTENAPKRNLGEYPVIILLDSAEAVTGDQNAQLDYTSILGTGSLSLIASWARECATSHPQCHKTFGSNGLTQPIGVWFPDRLIQITRTKSSEAIITLTARIVLKSNPADFPPDRATKSINYLSLSHCWGPPPDPSSPFDGRAGHVLTKSNISAWQKELPLGNLPLIFQHAIKTCASLGFGYMWIDSLCILQDSLEDWQEQSAVMGDVYKFAWLNIAALSSTSDYEGFINDSRDPRVEFGFRAPFASILGRPLDEKNNDGQACVLLRDRAKLLWNFSADIPGSNASNAPLFKRAWVYQERSLARRTLGFARSSVYWACDEDSRGERPDWSVGGLEATGLRGTLHGVLKTAALLAASKTESGVTSQRKVNPSEQTRALTQSIDMRWFLSVTSYTLCNLTKHTDKLIAVSSIARELANTRALGKKYLAGLWDVNLPLQIGWMTVKGESTPSRKRVGDPEYVAPSWS